MQRETKSCKECGAAISFLPEDLEFYTKMQAPAPRFCWECRMKRRICHRNERTLYKRKCSSTGKDIVSLYPESVPFPVYDQKIWWGDSWDAKDYAQEYDPSRPFLDQWIELRDKVPRISLLCINSVNSEYTNNAEDDKNCYLIFAAQKNEDCFYCRLLYRSKSIVDSAFVSDSELGYELIDCRSCFNCMFSERCQTSSDLLFCFDMRDSQNCILCTNGRHVKYSIFNQPCTKEEFEKKKSEILASYDNLEAAKKEFEKLKSQAVVKFAFQTKCHNAVGDFLHNCHDCWFAFDSENAKNCKYIADAESTIDCYDMNNTYYKPELNLDVMGALQGYNLKHSTYIMYGTNIEYSDSLHSCSDCFGCIGLRKAKYCILNKQYSEEEYKKLKAQIVEDMKKQEVYGDFLPPETSPYGFNETLAKEYFSMSKEEALEKGYKWQDAASGQFGKETISSDKMPQTIEEVKDDILDAILVDEETKQNFRITKGELDFYRRMHLPLPRKSFETRHHARMQKRNPRKLWQRTTADGKEVWTAYAPDRPEKILSEEAYQQTVE